jgi:hypothetical protein
MEPNEELLNEQNENEEIQPDDAEKVVGGGAGPYATYDDV